MTSIQRPIPRYADLDFKALWAEYPPAPDYFDTVYRLSRDELRALQDRRFRAIGRQEENVPAVELLPR